MNDLFDNLINRLQEELNPEEFKRWFSPVKYLGRTNQEISIEVPNIFFKNWIEDKYRTKITRILTEVVGKDIDITLFCPGQDPGMEEQEAAPETPPGPALVEEIDRFDTGLIDKYTFTNFVVGSSNQLAHAASQAVANKTASYNPLFIYGGSGLGKTHLLNAIGNHLLSQSSGLRVLYISSEDFTNELIEALRTEGMISFRNKHRNIDTLLIDDIHFIGGRERTQEEFFYTFNTLYEADKQIILSSDKMPKEIPDLEDRLRSRFEGGLFADISPPDRETKVAILSKKAEEEGIQLSNEVAFYLASQNETNIRVLEGYLARLGAYSSLTKKPIDLETSQKLLGLFIEAEQKQITIDLILKVTADFFHLKVTDLKSAKKQKAVSSPRQAAMYVARQMTSLSTIEIGQRFGGRDHSTVIHAVKKTEQRMEEDHNQRRTIEDLQKAIKNYASQKSKEI